MAPDSANRCTSSITQSANAFRSRSPHWGPKNVELTAEIAEGWQPVFFYPEKADAVWGEPLRAGFAKRDPALGPLDVMVSASLAIGDGVEDRLAWAKPQLALYIGGMGARGTQLLPQPGHPLRLR